MNILGRANSIVTDSYSTETAITMKERDRAVHGTADLQDSGGSEESENRKPDGPKVGSYSHFP